MFVANSHETSLLIVLRTKLNRAAQSLQDVGNLFCSRSLGQGLGGVGVSQCVGRSKVDWPPSLGRNEVDWPPS